MIPRQDNPSPTIILSTLNAKYIHASLGLRYLLSNMGDLRPQTVLREFTIRRKAPEIVDALLPLMSVAKMHGRQIVGFGVYIWNARETAAVLRLLKAVRPDITVVLGGPEVSHEPDQQEIAGLADHIITGWGDLSFPRLCRDLIQGQSPLPKVIIGEQPQLARISLPYAEYSDTDLAHRLLYVEASRGCPFKCEFCLSALDKSSWAFDLETFLSQMAGLYQRGARNFKFVDRTFNLKIETSVRILQFFLDRLSGSAGDLFLHFEVVPDHLPERLKEMIVQFPPGVLQFEVGVQSFNADVQQRISRKQDNAKTEINLRWLLEQSNAHVHADLIFGLPGETLESFAAGFDRLYALHPHEIQLGLLKRLRGTPIARHSAEFGMVYAPDPPYAVLQTGAVDVSTMERFTRFSRYWEKVANSGRFRLSVKLLLNNQPSPFKAFLDFADWLWHRAEKTSDLSPELLIDALFDYLCGERKLPVQSVQQTLLEDYVSSGARSHPRALFGLLPKRDAPMKQARRLAQRQGRHLAAR